MGKSVIKERWAVIVNPTKNPISMPKSELENTRTKASYTYNSIISFFLTPTHLKTPISLVYCIILPPIVLTKLKKQITMTIIVIILNIRLITVWIFYGIELFFTSQTFKPKAKSNPACSINVFILLVASSQSY